jgi:hypothetical protein
MEPEPKKDKCEKAKWVQPSFKQSDQLKTITLDLLKAATLNCQLSKFLLRIEPEESAKKEIKIREEILSLRPKRKVKKPEPFVPKE